MENLNIDDAPPMGGAAPLLGPGPPQQSPQLPPQMFTTAAQLLDMTDSKKFTFLVLSQVLVAQVGWARAMA